MSQVATTLEQSKRLRNAGLSPDTADFFWLERQYVGNSDRKRDVPEPILGWIRQPDGKLPKGDPCCCGMSFDYIPAWSLSKLVDICDGALLRSECNSEEMVASLVNSIIFLIDCGDIDLKYLDKHGTD